MRSLNQKPIAMHSANLTQKTGYVIEEYFWLLNPGEVSTILDLQQL